MKTKIIVGIAFFLLLIAFCLFSPLYFRWHQEYFEISDHAMFVRMMGMVIVLTALLGVFVWCLQSIIDP